MSLSQPNTPSAHDAAGWSFLSVYLNMHDGNGATWSESPQLQSRPESGIFARDINAPSAHTTMRSRSASQHGSAQDDDDDEGFRSYTSATVRTGSAALEPIIEGAAIDQDTSLGDTSAFVFDRYRFSNSIRSEPTGTSAPGSPVIGRRSASTSRTSRSLSRQGMDASLQDNVDGFKPKQFLLNGFTGDRRQSRQLSRSFSVPVLNSEAVRADKSVRQRLVEEGGRGMGGSPSSPSTPHLMLTASLPEKLPSPPRVFNRRSVPAAAPIYGSHAERALEESSYSTALTAQNPMRHRAIPRASKPVPAEIRSSFPVKEDPGVTQRTSPYPPSAGHTSLQQAPTDTARLSTPLKHASACETDADRTLRADSLSPPRSAASVDTRSSEPVELVPWLIATTDSMGTRSSEDIFRPLSMALSMSRGGAGSSRDTTTSGPFAGLSVADTGSRRSTLQAQQTALKGGSDFLWGRPEPESEDASRQSRSVARPSELTQDGVRSFVPAASMDSPSKQMLRHVGIPAQADSHRGREPSTGASREFTIDSPPGGVDRLLLELGHSSIDSQLNNGVGGDIEGSGYAHRRSSTLNHIQIEPRRSSICRRHWSLDVASPQRRRSSLKPSLAMGTKAVIEEPSGPHTDGEESSRPPHPWMNVRDTRLGVPPDSDVAKGSPNPKATTKAANTPHIPSKALTLSLQAFIISYQALFFTFEAPYLWTAVALALPLAAAAVFLVLDVIILQMHLLPSMRTQLFLGLVAMMVLATAYCSALSVVKVAKLARSSDRGAEAPSIHFHRARSTHGNALQEVLRDMPISAVLFVLGAGGAVFGGGLAAWLSLKLWRRRKRQD